MTPEYLEQLAEVADTDQVWRTPLLDQLALPAAQRQQLDMGVALRRHASHVHRVQALIGTGRSLLLTPYGPSTTAVATIETPENHRRPVVAVEGDVMYDPDRCPWPDYNGNPIHHGDRMWHPVSGQTFTAVRLHGIPDPGNAWRAIYDSEDPVGVSRLCLQIGDKGMAVVIKTDDECPS